MDFTAHAATTIDASPGAVFDALTDIRRLPEWNREIAKIIEAPDAVTVGSQWLVEIRAMKTHWNSRSQAVEVDASRGVFAYRSVSDDGNPSHADWRWTLSSAGDGTRVEVSVDVHPRTFWRKYLLSTLRRSSLDRAMHESLHALREHVSMR